MRLDLRILPEGCLCCEVTVAFEVEVVDKKGKKHLQAYKQTGHVMRQDGESDDELKLRGVEYAMTTCFPVLLDYLRRQVRDKSAYTRKMSGFPWWPHPKYTLHRGIQAWRIL